MLTVRSRYDHYQKHYLQNLYEQYGQIPENHMKAMRLRMDFFSNYVLDRVTHILISIFLIFLIVLEFDAVPNHFGKRLGVYCKKSKII